LQQFAGLNGGIGGESGKPSTSPVRRIPAMTYRTFLLAGTALMLLTACGDDTSDQARGSETRIYGSLEACLDDAESPSDGDICRQGYEKAQKRMAHAPRFEEKSKCEAGYGPGNCIPYPPDEHTAGGRGGSWSPAFLGYMLGRNASTAETRYWAEPVYRNRDGYTYAPSHGRLDLPPDTDDAQRRSTVYSKSRIPGEFTSSTWITMPRGTAGSITNPSGSRAAAMGRSSVSRGGFGSTASMHSSFGG
jgi:uncharacterized protein YgiB involved in biofilm formation